jgi:predicted Zn-dependent peptidase
MEDWRIIMDKDLKIIPVPVKSNATIVGLFAKVGSRNEPNNIKGISHFIEHLCFKGTKKRTCKEIAQTVEQYGGDLNAFTDYEVTCYWAKMANDYVKIALDVICDLVTQPIFPSKEINKEREVIIQELKMYLDDPKDYVWDLFNKIYFKESSGLYLSVIGTEKSLHDINRKKIIDFYNKYYQNLTLVIVGDTKGCKEFTTFQEKRIDIPNEKLFTFSYDNAFYQSRKDVKQANVIMGNFLHRINNSTLEDIFSTALLAGIYNDMSGRLFTKIREKNNLCYRIRFIPNVYSDGLIMWTVSIGLEKNKINNAREMIIKELTRPFTKNEIKIAVQKTIGEQEIHFDNLNHILETVVYCEIKGLDYREFLSNYRKNINKASKNLNDFKDKINFKNNLLVGVIPE